MTAEIGNIGERQVTAWLQANGYTCYRNTQLPGSTDIEASGIINGLPVNLLVQVKTAVSPNSPAFLTADELNGITARAKRNSCQAHLARVVINNNGLLIGSIDWTKLN